MTGFFFGMLIVLAAAALAVWGLLLLHRGRNTGPSRLVSIAGLLALLVGLATALCAGYHLVKYRQYLGTMSGHAMMDARIGKPHRNMGPASSAPQDRKAGNTTAPVKTRGDENSR